MRTFMLLLALALPMSHDITTSNTETAQMTTPYDGWVWPVELHAGDGRKPVISDGFSRISRCGRGHYGVDIMYRRGVDGVPKLPEYTKHFECRTDSVRVLACGPGTVWSVHVHDPHGISLEIDHHNLSGDGPRISAYRHLARCVVTKGQQVEPGDLLGIVGYDRTMDATRTPNHLHFELWDTSLQLPGDAGKPSRIRYGFDPAPVMRQWSYRGRDGALLVG